MTIQESMAQYKNIKLIFKNLIGKKVIVEMNGQEIDHWIIHNPNSDSESLQIRSRLTFEHINFFSFTSHLSGNRYFYTDENILISEELQTGEILYFSNLKTSDFFFRLSYKRSESTGKRT